MAKLFKHLGLGGKKTPPNPPKPDYGLKSTSVQDLLSKSQITDRFGDGTNTISVCEFDEAMTHTGSTRSIDRKMREKDRFSLSRQYNKSERYSVNVSDDFRGRLEISVDNDLAAKANRTPPGLLADYSDPCDLKKQIVQQTVDLLTVSANADMAQQSDDDYSVPYDVKKKTQEKQPFDSSAKQSIHPVASGSSIGTNNTLKAGNKSTTNTSTIQSPQPYEEAWEWLTPMQAVNGLNNGVVSINTVGSTTENKSSDQSDMVNNHEAMSTKPNGGCATAADNAISGQVKAIEQEGEKLPAPPTLDTQVETNEGNLITFEEDSIAVAINKALASGINGNDGPQAIIVSKPVSNARQQGLPGNYEEPWDLVNTQEKLEEKLRLAAMGNGGFVQVAVPNQSEVISAPVVLSVSSTTPVHVASANNALPSTSTSSTSTVPMTLSHEMPQDARSMEGYDKPWDWKPHKKDDRAQEGYDKPWDWKPHKKDDRAQEGYDKPWDWKPHQKDSRPATEYDQPWDQKAKGIEKELMKVKGVAVAGGSDVSRGKKDADVRPPEEYDTPWDQKAKKLQNKLSGGDAGQPSSESPSKSPGASVPLSLSPLLQSPHARPSPTSGATQSPVTERIDQSLPLEQQGWYHGAISRTDAEALLRIHPEGSYLVRQSESNKQDFSLSLKSSRGFMHMKIVNRDNKFILGQFSQPFDNIPQMILHYSRNKLPIKGAEHMVLLRPIINDML